ncbi:D-amino acid oxidase 1 [Arctopsyche grandis]|uniref:D-amino acid oxidase 1 n=1 Tax=Arctopsyche grandis TaxID=121162 RepID=UPI00406DA461
MNKAPKVGIVGAGVVGLTTALLIQDEIKGAQVSILADKFENETTSFVAAGVFRPGTSFSGPDDGTTKQWVSQSWDHWNDLVMSSDAPLAGLTYLSGYIFSKRNPSVVRNHLIEDVVPIYRSATEEELKICGDGWKYGSFFTTLLVESRLYLPWAKKKFLSKDGIVRFKQIQSFSDLKNDYDVIINCTGLNSRELCSDNKLVPIRGQIIKVEAPWVKMAFYGDYDAYILPGFEGVTLGGTRQYDSFNLDVCKYDAAGIMDRCSELLPALRKARVIRHAVGLRPHRSPVRVEGEIMEFGSDTTKVVHCYGHGGYGVTCAPGTGKHAVKIVKQFLMTNQSKL